MNLRLAILRHVFPTRIKFWMLDELARVTAEGFGIQVPDWPAGPFEARLTTYARATAQESARLLARADEAAVEVVRRRLSLGAAALGTKVRSRLGLRGTEEAFETLRLLYRQIGIEVTGCAGGDLTVMRCFFADYYSEPVCRVISALDEGMAAGLFGGASLEFSERLTGGRPCCRALLRLEESAS